MSNKTPDPPIEKPKKHAKVETDTATEKTMKFVFDNDGTLYDDTKVQYEFKSIFTLWASQILDCPVEEIWAVAEKLKLKWSTDFSAIAFMKEFDLSFEDVISETYLKVHLSEHNVISSASVLVSTLSSLHGEKVVLTNNPSQFAKRILDVLGVRDEFSSIIGMGETNFLGKPEPAAYRSVEVLFPRSKPEEFVFFDDSRKNLDAAKLRGWKTVQISKDTSSPSSDHITIQSINDLRELVF